LVDIPKKKIFKNSLVRPAGRMWPFLIHLFFLKQIAITEKDDSTYIYTETLDWIII